MLDRLTGFQFLPAISSTFFGHRSFRISLDPFKYVLYEAVVVEADVINLEVYELQPVRILT